MAAKDRAVLKKRRAKGRKALTVSDTKSRIFIKSYTTGSFFFYVAQKTQNY